MSQVEILVHTVRVIFCFEHLKYSLLMLISFKNLSYRLRLPDAPHLTHYVSLDTVPNIIQTLTPLFKRSIRP